MNEDINKISTDIMNIFSNRRFHELNHIMNNIFIRDDKIELIVNLADRLPGKTMDDLLLCGIEYLITLTIKEYVRMFELANERDIAFYRLTRFMRFHGLAPREAFRRLGVDMDKLDDLDHVRFLSFIGESEEMAAERARQMTYRDLNISAEEIVKFRRKLAEFSF